MVQNSITWAVVAIIGILVMGEILEDPKVKAMQICVRGMPDSQKQIECARSVFGDK